MKAVKLIQNRLQKQGMTSDRMIANAVITNALVLTMGLMTLGAMPLQAVHGAGLNDLFSEQTSGGKFLPVHQAFNVMPSIQGDKVSVYVDITPGHYLYRDKLKLSLPDGITATPLQFDKSAHFVDDPSFGKVAVFDQNNVTATAILTNTQGKRLTDVPVTVNWQGCAKAGLCYPPEKTQFVISLDATGKNDAHATQEPITIEQATTNSHNISKQDTSKQDASKQDTSKVKTAQQTNTINPNNNLNDNTQEKTADTATSSTIKNDITGNDATTTTHDNPSTDVNIDPSTDLETQVVANQSLDNLPADPSHAVTLTEMAEKPSTNTTSTNTTSINTTNTNTDAHANDPFGLASHPALALLLIFLAGLTLAFTPCVLPMLPIVANIVAQQKQVSQRRSVILSGSYALGVAVAYGLLGAVIAYFGQALGILGWLQNPVILGGFALVFVLLALYMLDVVSFRLPSAISQPLQKLSQAGNQRLGSVGGSFLVGLLSALVVSPCVSAPLSGSLLAVATIGSVPLGFMALFLLGLGLSLPLVVLAATGGKLMPKAGEWMNWIKEGMAYLLFAVALLLLERVLQSPVMLMLWALWFAVVAFWWHKWSQKTPLLSRAMNYVMLLWAGCLMVGAAMGAKDSWHPLQPLTAGSGTAGILANDTLPNTAFAQSRITTLAELDQLLAQHDKVVVDVTADWCIECRIMEQSIFNQLPSQMADWHLVRLDITETTEESKAILARYQLFGPPSLLYYVDGHLQEKQVGEIKRQTFIDTLDKLS